MKRIIALLLGIVLLTSVAAADNELYAIVAEVENYLANMEDGIDTATLETCLERLENMGNKPLNKTLEIYCKILLNIEQENFDAANQGMYALTLLKEQFDEAFIAGNGGNTPLFTVDELGFYLQGREAEYHGDLDAALAAYEQCLAKADAWKRVQNIEDEQYGNAIDLISVERYDEARAMLEKLAERNYYYAEEVLRNWVTPEPTATGDVTWVSVQAFGDEYIGVGVTDENGVITSLTIDASSQTPGLGQECASEAFTSQFIGKRAPFVLNENIDAVTSATITSQAIVDAVNSIYGY